MAGSDIRNELSTGLPDLPYGLPDKEYGLVAPIYRALATFAANVSKAVGLSTYPTERYPSLTPRDTLQVGRLSYAVFPASQALVFGEPVNLWDDSGTLRARKADAVDDTKPCVGICIEAGGVAVGEYGKVLIGPGLVNATMAYTGTLYLAVGGGLTNVKPSGAGNIVQTVGVALDDKGLWFSPSTFAGSTGSGGGGGSLPYGPILEADASLPLSYVGYASRIVRLDYTSWPPDSRVALTSNLVVDWPNRATLTYV